jgi:hypothetical protein
MLYIDHDIIQTSAMPHRNQLSLNPLTKTRVFRQAMDRLFANPGSGFRDQPPMASQVDDQIKKLPVI